MLVKKLTLMSRGFPEGLRHLPQPPAQLYVVGEHLGELMARPRVAIVGSRKITPYGRQVTADLAARLAGEGVVVVSGLALGVDAWGQQAALEAGGQVIAVLPGPVENVIPATNRPLARRIVERGGALVSEYAAGEQPYKQNFIARNRLVAGLADALLITEAAEKSGSLHTARFALEQGKEMLAVPGDITKPSSVGTNNLIKAGHAAAVTSYEDVLHALGLDPGPNAKREVRGRNAHEQAVLDLLVEGVGDGTELLERSRLKTGEFNQALTMLEISGKVRSLGANRWAIYAGAGVSATNRP